MKRVAVFCGASTGNDPAFLAAAAELGQKLAARGIGIVYGGGSIGLMGAMATAARKAGGQLVSVIPKALAPVDMSGPSIGTLFLTPDMHQRKEIIFHLSDAFIALPGGLGTFEEVMEGARWSQLKIHQKPVAFVNVNGFYDSMLQQLQRSQSDGFMTASDAAWFSSGSTIDQVLSQLTAQMQTIVPSSADAPYAPSAVAQAAAAQLAQTA